MSQSYKNILQEYCHEYKIVLGKYQTVNVGGESHNPEWKSSITVDGKIYTHIGKGSKVSVETELAKTVVEFLNSSKCIKSIIHEKVGLINYSSPEKKLSTNEILKSLWETIQRTLAETDILTVCRIKDEKLILMVKAGKMKSQKYQKIIQELIDIGVPRSAIETIELEEGCVSEIQKSINKSVPTKNIMNDFESLYPGITKNMIAEGKEIGNIQENQSDKIDQKSDQIYTLLKPSDFKKKLAVFINYDNIKIDDKIPAEFPDIDFYVFMSPAGFVNYSSNLQNVIIKEVKHQVKDACDHLISYTLGSLTKYYDKIIVCTRDAGHGAIIQDEFWYIHLKDLKSLKTEIQKIIKV